MAVTENTYTGNGSTVLYSFTFPYLDAADIKVSLNGTPTTAYTLANATTVQFNTAPANGVAIRIYRVTDDAALAATFISGSAIRATDLNENFTQNLYVTQESNRDTAAGVATANTALTNSNTAISTANTALSQSNTAISDSATALSQSNTAISDSATALSQSNTAISDSASAVSTANSAASDASTALSQSNTAISDSATALSQSNTAIADSATAVSDSATALSTANTALSTANTALSTANTADANANAALNAIAGTVQYVLVANVANIPISPANGDAIEIADSTGVESFTPLSNLPSGFVGDTGLSVRLQYLSSGSTWNWLNYFPNNAETRYLKLAGGSVTGNLEIGAAGSLTFEGSTADTFETTLTVVDPTADRTITLPDVTGTVVTTGDTGTVTSTMIADGTIVDDDISATAEIAVSKLADGAARQLLQTDAAGTGVEWTDNVDVPGTLDVTGAATFDSTTVATDSSTAASFIPTGSTVPANGVYLPAANSVGLSTNGTGRLFVDASGNVGVGTATPASNGPTFATLSLNGSNGGAQHFMSAGNTVMQMYNDANDFYAVAGTGKQIIIEVGGSEAARFDTSGRLGIGSSAPNCQLTNTGTTSLGTNAWPTSAIGRSNGRAIVGNEGQLILWNETVGAGNSGQLYIGTKSGSNSTDLGYARISAGTENASNLASFFKLETMNSSGTLGTGLYLDSSQRVGIGTTSVSDKLHVSGIARVARSTDATQYGTISVETGNVVIDAQGNVETTFRNNGSEKVRIDSSGRLLVGTSTARSNMFSGGSLTTPFLVETASSTNRAPAIINNENGVSGPVLVLGKTRSGAVGGNTLVQSGDEIGILDFQAADGTNLAMSARIAAYVDGTPGANDMPGRLVFSTTADGASSPTERMRITSAGALKASSVSFTDGVSANTHVMFNNNNVSGDICLYLGLKANAINTSSNMLVCTNIGVADVLLIRGNGNVLNTNNSYTGISDVKLKENVVDANSQWQDIKALQVRNYNFKEETGLSTHRQIGLIAQEVETVCPHLVDESPDRDAEGNDLGTTTKSVQYSVLYMKAVKALQEAMERIEQLEAEMAEVKAQLS